MKLKNSYFFTMRENSSEEESISGNLLVKSGMIKKSSSGVYMFLPLGYKVLNNINNIIRDEMNKIDSSELLMPSMISEDVFAKSGRKDKFGASVMSFNDRFDKKYILGPTHEELFAIAATYKVKSYKDLPFSLYQIQNKFRDEARPRYGLLRTREFLMKDAYSFDATKESQNESYLKMFNAYNNVFNRLDLNTIVVKSDTGAMGGELSEEFQVECEIGEDTIVTCDCGYTSNIDIACSAANEVKSNEQVFEKELVYTPNSGTIEEISEFLKEDKSKFIKSLIYKVDKDFVLVLINGMYEVNEIKLCSLLNTENLSLASEEDVVRITSSKVGFAGPIGINIRIVADNSVKNMVNFIVGANRSDYHYKNVNLCDFEIGEYGDISYVKQGDLCPKCHNPLLFKKSIEVGNCFKLGTKYSESFGLMYKDETNNLKPVLMGSYGIGPARCMSTIVETHYDEKGIIWPKEVAPYKVYIVLANIYDEQQVDYASKLYNELISNNIDTILDDRDERIGVKFNDADLIGIPIRITVGKGLVNNMVEFRLRTESESKEYDKEQIINIIKNVL